MVTCVGRRSKYSTQGKPAMLLAFTLLTLFVVAGCATQEAHLDEAGPPQTPEQSRLEALTPAEQRNAFEEIVVTLCSDAMGGRAWHEAGLNLAHDYLVGQIEQELDLSPGMKDGTFSHAFTHRPRKAEPLYESRNIVALLPGRGSLANEAVIIMAHYDHIGRDGATRAKFDPRWKDTWKELDPKPIHPGADDNASGVAAAILATRKLKVMFETQTDHRAVMLLLTSAEEIGLVGVRKFVMDEAQAVMPLDNVYAAVNLDMVGRLGAEGLGVYGVDDWKPWQPAIVQAREGMDLNVVTDRKQPGFGDELILQRQDIPTVLVNTGLHDDYHTPADTPDKLNYDGSVTITNFIARLLYVLATT